MRCNSMKLIVIGLGSMGKRRITLLSKYFTDISICGVDINTERRLQVGQLFGINTYGDLNKAIYYEKPYAALVCSSPASHGAIILECIRAGLHIFSEINLIQDKYKQIIKEAEQYKVKLFLSSTLLYRKEIEIINEYVSKQKSRVNYRYHVGQYLPDWHPWEDYKNFFASDKRTNGCREIFAIDLPWILKTFGKVKDITVFKDNISTLEVEYPDNYIVVLEHDNGNKGVFIVDIVSRQAVRDFLVYSENLHMSWDGTPKGLYKYNIEKRTTERIETYTERIETYNKVESDYRYVDKIVENAYLDELTEFINKIIGKPCEERYTFEDDIYTLQLIDRIEGI